MSINKNTNMDLKAVVPLEDPSASSKTSPSPRLIGDDDKKPLMSLGAADIDKTIDKAVPTAIQKAHDQAAVGDDNKTTMKKTTLPPSDHSLLADGGAAAVGTTGQGKDASAAPNEKNNNRTVPEETLANIISKVKVEEEKTPAAKSTATDNGTQKGEPEIVDLFDSDDDGDDDDDYEDEDDDYEDNGDANDDALEGDHDNSHHDAPIIVQEADLQEYDTLVGAKSRGRENGLRKALVEPEFDMYWNAVSKIGFVRDKCAEVWEQGGRFLEAGAVEGSWIVLKPRAAIQKVQQHFLDYAKQFKKSQLAKQQGHQHGMRMADDTSDAGVGENDVLCGKGTQRMDRNISRVLVKKHVQQYLHASKKKEFCDKLYRDVVDQGGRFLVIDQTRTNNNGAPSWTEISKVAAVVKMVQSFHNYIVSHDVAIASGGGLLAKDTDGEVVVDKLEKSFGKHDRNLRQKTGGCRATLSKEAALPRNSASPQQPSKSNAGADHAPSSPENAPTIIQHPRSDDILCGLQGRPSGTHPCSLFKVVIEPNASDYIQADVSERGKFVRSLVCKFRNGQGRRFLKKLWNGTWIEIQNEGELVMKLSWSFRESTKKRKASEAGLSNTRTDKRFHSVSAMDFASETTEEESFLLGSEEDSDSCGQEGKEEDAASEKLVGLCKKFDENVSGASFASTFGISGGIGDTLAAMAKFSGHAGVQANGLCLLCKLVSVNKGVFVAFGCVEKLIGLSHSAMMVFSGDTHVHMNALELVGLLWHDIATEEARNQACELISYVKVELASSTSEQELQKEVIKQGLSFLWHVSGTKFGREAILSSECDRAVHSRFNKAKDSKHKRDLWALENRIMQDYKTDLDTMPQFTWE